MAIRFLSNQTIDSTLTTTGAITSGGNLRVSSGILYVGNGSNTTARIMGFGDTEMITGVSGATYLRVSGTSTLAGTLQGGQYILATGLAYGAVNSYTQIIDGSTGAITGTSATFTASVTAAGNSNTFGNTTIAALSATSGTFSASVTAAGNSNSFGETTFSNVLTINPGSSTVATETFRRDTNGDGQIIGDINFNTTAAEGTDDRISLIRSRTSGGAATSRGGELLFYTRKSGSADFNLTTYDKDGNWTFPGSVTFTGSITTPSILANGFMEIRSDTASLYFENAANNNYYRLKRSSNDFVIDYYNGTTTSDRLKIDSSGNVGIGVTASDYWTNANNLVVGGLGAVSGITIATDGNLTGSLIFADGTGGGDNTRGGLQYNHSTDDMLFRVNNAEKMRITSTGDVGIGTSAPEGKLDVTGNIWLNSDNANAAYYLRINRGQSQDGGILLYGNKVLDWQLVNLANRDLNWYSYGVNSSVMRLTSAGNLGIGTTSPTSKLHLRDPGVNSDVGIKIGNDSRDWNLKVMGSVSDSLQFFTHDNSNVMTILPSGNVGIGTTSPTNGKFVINQNSSAASFGGNICQLFENFNTTDGQMMSIGFRNNNSIGTTAYIDAVAYDQSIGATDIRFSTYSGSAWSSNMVTFQHTGRVGIGTTSPGYNLEIGGTANPKIAITSNINSATSSLYFGDSDSTDKGQIVYTHFGDFMELKAGGATRVYIESGINTAYTADGLFNSNATPSYWNHGNGQFKLGYMDNGSGLYSGAYAFNVKSTDGIPVTGREIGAIYINDTSNGRRPLRISNQGRITMDQTNTSTDYGSATGWLTIANGTGAYNFYNAYTGTDGGSGCARYRLNNTSPSFFDFYYTTTQVGYITTNGTDIFYANTSDYRLKEDLKSFDGMSLLEQIQVYDFKWKESDNRMYGVVAHELQEVIPQAVVGDKDEEKLQAVDYSKLVPVLIKSIQELEARVKELENN